MKFKCFSQALKTFKNLLLTDIIKILFVKYWMCFLCSPLQNLIRFPFKMSSWYFTELLCTVFLLRLAWHSAMRLFTWGTLFNLTELSVNLTYSREKLVISFVCPWALNNRRDYRTKFLKTDTEPIGEYWKKTLEGRYLSC